jgi:glutaredoxin 3
MSRVVVYSRSYCGFCSMAMRLLDERGIAYEVRDATARPEVRAEMMQRTNGFTFPQVVIDDRPIGGFRELHQLDQSGALERMFDAAAGDAP